jgi:hypothetical protein
MLREGTARKEVGSKCDGSWTGRVEVNENVDWD